MEIGQITTTTATAISFLTTILFVTSHVTEGSELRTCPWKRLPDDVVPSGSVIDTTLRADTLQQCAALCLDRSVCEGFCYNKTTSHCYVINMAASAAAPSVSYSGLMKCYGLAGSCPYSKGYSLYGCRCIRFVDNAVNYPTANSTCSSEGAHLYNLKSHTVDRKPYFDLLKFHAKSIDGTYWVGADDLKVTGDYRWSDGSPLPLGAKEWRAGEPNYVPEHCVVMSMGFLYDIDCDTRNFAFACQKDIDN